MPKWEYAALVQVQITENVLPSFAQIEQRKHETENWREITHAWRLVKPQNEPSHIFGRHGSRDWHTPHEKSWNLSPFELRDVRGNLEAYKFRSLEAGFHWKIKGYEGQNSKQKRH